MLPSASRRKSPSSATPPLTPSSTTEKKKKTDPHCIWNPYVRRWIVTGYQQVSGGRSLTPIAVSAADVPGGGGTWTTYRVPSWDGTAVPGLTGCNTATPCLPDYPSLGYNENAVVITTNQFALSGGNYLFQGAMVIAMPTAGLVSGSPFVYRAKLPVPSMKVSLLSSAGQVPTGSKLWLVATYGSGALYLTTVSSTNSLASSQAPATASQVVSTTISVSTPASSPLLSNGVTAFDTVDTRVMSFSVAGSTRGLCTLNTAYSSGGYTKMGVAYYFLDIPASGAATQLYSGIFADAAYHAWDGGAALNPSNVDVAYFVGVVATVPTYSPVTYPTASFLGALQRGVGVVSTQALVSGTNGQLLRGFATPKIRSGDYPAAAIDPDTGVFW